VLAISLVGGIALIGVVIALLIGVGALRVVPSDGTAVIREGLRSLLVLVPASLDEELLVRGYALTTIAAWLGWPLAVAFTSLAFGAMHLLNPGATALSVAAVTLAGVVLALVRWRTGSLAAAWIAHLGWNVSMVALAHVAVSGLAFPAPQWRVIDAGPAWLTGGAWGPEGGAAAVVALALASVVLWRGIGRRTPGTALTDRITNEPRPDGRMESVA
jgi:membrane protease YdiL (CAAX protease family)